MYMPSIAKDLLKSSEPPAEKSLTRKWIEHMLKQMDLVSINSLEKNDAQLLKMISENLETLLHDSKEYNKLKEATKVINSFSARNSEPMFPFGYSGCYPGCGH